MTQQRLIRVQAPHFTAALVLVDRRCVEAAPILKWAIGKTEAQVKGYVIAKGWDFEEALQ